MMAQDEKLAGVALKDGAAVRLEDHSHGYDGEPKEP